MSDDATVSVPEPAPALDASTDADSTGERIAKLEAEVAMLRAHAKFATEALQKGGPVIGNLSRAVAQLQAGAAAQPSLTTEMTTLIQTEAKAQAKIYAREILHAEAKRISELAKALEEARASVSFLFQKYNALVWELKIDKPGESMLRLNFIDGRQVTVRREITINEPGSGTNG